MTELQKKHVKAEKAVQLWEKPFLRKRANWFVPAGLNFPANPPYALLTEGKVKRAKRSGKR